MGEVVDEFALIQALMFDVIGGAALDVFDGEPRISPDLLQCDNLVMLPHLGSATRESPRGDGVSVSWIILMISFRVARRVTG